MEKAKYIIMKSDGSFYDGENFVDNEDYAASYEYDKVQEIASDLESDGTLSVYVEQES